MMTKFWFMIYKKHTNKFYLSSYCMDQMMTLTNSTQFVCKRCGHGFNCKSNLIKHLRRKNPCVVTQSNISIADHIDELLMVSQKKYQCQLCQKMFSTRQSKHKHLMTCKNKTSSTNNLQMQILSLSNQISELQKQVSIIKHH